MGKINVGSLLINKRLGSREFMKVGNWVLGVGCAAAIVAIVMLIAYETSQRPG